MLKGHRGVIVLAKWPRPRPGRKSPLQQAWIDRFSLLARNLKSPDPITLMAAQYWSKGTGWYYRDVLENAAYGKLIRYQNEPRVITPTVKIHASSTQAMPTNSDTRITANVLDWDNNSFAPNFTNGSRLTFKSAGLYQLSAWVHWTDFTTSFRYCWLKDQAGNQLVYDTFAGATAIDFQAKLNCLFYAHVNDYVEVWGHSNAASNHAQLGFFTAVAITPEALVP